MTNIILFGCGGRMGRVCDRVISADKDAALAAGIDLFLPEGLSYPVFKKAFECNVPADVVIGFSTAGGVLDLLDFALLYKLPVVICSTGLLPETLEKVKKASEEIPVLYSANMSIGVNLILKLTEEISKTLWESGFDIEIVEKHHNQKLDAPSGTAYAIAQAANKSMSGSLKYVYDRTGIKQKRDRFELGIHSVRGGSIVGEHDVIFAGADETITISHSALSREIFARGALFAAKFLKDKPSGLYSMQDAFK